ncbi:MAG: hypothetical protein NC922_06245 [Candidatus Omnitrophica bacterium]|nr:hypothetical protein [Candidatus Omnitrophota bacterium]
MKKDGNNILKILVFAQSKGCGYLFNILDLIFLVATCFSLQDITHLKGAATIMDKIIGDVIMRVNECFTNFRNGGEVT